MKFEKHFELIMSLISEAEAPAPIKPVNEEEPPPPLEGPDGGDDLENMDATDALSDESALDAVDDLDEDKLDDQAVAEETQLVELTKILADSLRFKPSKEFMAFVNMPMFKSLSDAKKLREIQNVIQKHPERITEANEDPMGGGSALPDMEDPLGAPENGDDEKIEPKMLLSMIIRAFSINPDTLNYTLPTLTTVINKDSYKGVINTIKTVLF